MKNVWRYIAIGVVVYLLVLLATFPAARIVPVLEQQIDGLALQGVSGTAITGHAGRLHWQGNDLGAASWHLQPLRQSQSPSRESKR